MEVLQDLALHTLTLYNTTIPHLRPLLSSLTPYLDKLAILAHDSPALLSFGVLLLFLIIAVKVLSWIKRILMWWVGLVFKIAFWGFLIVLVSVVSQRGLGRTAGDIAGFGQEVGEVWGREYRRWEGYRKQAQAQAQAEGREGMAGTKAGSGWR